MLCPFIEKTIKDKEQESYKKRNYNHTFVEVYYMDMQTTKINISPIRRVFYKGVIEIDKQKNQTYNNSY